MTTIREWLHSLDGKPGYSKRRVYDGIRKQMGVTSKFNSKWWDTVITKEEWRTMLREALK